MQYQIIHLRYSHIVIYSTTTLKNWMETTMKPNRTILALFVALLTLPLAALGKGEGTSTGMASNNETIDDIVVVGQKSLSALRKDVFEAEEDFYAVFNKLNDEKDFDVRCHYEKATGTHIKNHVCRARFVTKAFSSHAARNRNDLSRVANQDANPAFAAKTAEYNEKVEALVTANPELQAAFLRYNEKRVLFFAEREGVANN